MSQCRKMSNVLQERLLLSCSTIYNTWTDLAVFIGRHQQDQNASNGKRITRKWPLDLSSTANEDYYTRGRTHPELDTKQNYKLLNASEVGGYTELMFERPRDTGDDNDLAFQPGEEVHIIWAYRDTDIINEGDIRIHSRRGWSPQKVVMVPGQQPIPTEPAAASSLHSSIHAIITLTIVLINVLLMYN